MPEFIDPVFTKQAQNARFQSKKKAFWACFRENSVYNFGHRKQATVGRQQCREASEVRPATEGRLAHELPRTSTVAGTPFMVVQYSDSYWNNRILLEVTTLVLKDSWALLHSPISFIYVLSTENKT